MTTTRCAALQGVFGCGRMGRVCRRRHVHARSRRCDACIVATWRTATGVRKFAAVAAVVRAAVDPLTVARPTPEASVVPPRPPDFGDPDSMQVLDAAADGLTDLMATQAARAVFAAWRARHGGP